MNKQNHSEKDSEKVKTINDENWFKLIVRATEGSTNRNSKQENEIVNSNEEKIKQIVHFE